MRNILLISCFTAAALLKAGEELDPAVLERVKAATVYVRIPTTKQSEVQTAGFFCDEDLIATYTYNIEFWAKDKKFSVVLNSGILNKEKVLDGEFIFAANKLAFVRIKPNGLATPKPLDISNGERLTLDTPVFAVTFPVGETVRNAHFNPGVDIAASTIRDLNADRNSYEWFLHSWEHPGFVVLQSGEVLGVNTVSARLYQRDMAAPDELRDDLDGRLWYSNLSYETHKDNHFTFHIKAQTVDPQARIESAAFYGWTAEPGVLRPSDPVTKLNLHGAEGDTPKIKVELKRTKDGAWEGDAKEVLIPENKEFWYQIGLSRTKPRGETLSSAQNSSLVKPKRKYPGFDPKQVQDRDGRVYIDASSIPQKVVFPDGLIQLVSAPNGEVVYGIFKNDSGIKLFEPPTFKEIGEIPAPRFPVSIWCDEKRIVVACDESRAVAIIDAQTRNQIRAVKLTGLSNSLSDFPARICGRAPDGSIMSLWRSSKDDWRNVSLYTLQEDGRSKYVAKGNMRWCVLVEDAHGLLAQHAEWLNDGEGTPFLIDLQTGKETFGIGDAPLSSSLLNCFRSFNQKGIICPFYVKNRTYILSNDLKQISMQVDGCAVAELPKEGILICIGVRHFPADWIHYVSTSTGKVVRTIQHGTPSGTPDNKNSDIPLNVFVPKHELLLSIDPRNSTNVFVTRCGPVDNQPEVAGAVIVNNPPASIRIGEKLLFRPAFSYNKRVTFKLKTRFDGMTIDKLTGDIEWTPAKVYVGTYDLTILAQSESEGDMEVGTWTIEIMP
jgi:hypothetical protein